MLDLPKNTVFGKRILKQKFYDNLSMTPQMKRIFAQQINLITWQYKIAPSTINIAEGETVKEIEVITIKLNQRELDKRVLPLIDKKIPYHILFLFEYGGEVQAWVGYKEQAKYSTFKPSAYYHTEWLQPDTLNLRIDGLDLDKIYENFVRQIAGKRLGDTGDGIINAIKRDKKLQQLVKDITVLDKKIKNEQQFNRQVKLNNKLKQLKSELEKING